MLRAIAMAARLGFTIDAPIDEAIASSRAEIARSAPARLIEEFYKLLRSGASEQAFRMMAERRLLEPIAHELQRAGREVTLAVGEHVRGPRVYRGRDIQWWMEAAGVLGERYDEVGRHLRVRAHPSVVARLRAQR